MVSAGETFIISRSLWRSPGLSAHQLRSVTDGTPLLRLQSELPRAQGDPVARLHRVHALIDAPGLLLEPAAIAGDDAPAGAFRWDSARPLTEVLREGELDLESALSLTHQCALLLEAVHRRDGVHGALSIESILWSTEERRLRLADLAFVSLPELPDLPHPGRGSRAVLQCQAPEATEPAALAGPTVEGDLYSLGAILYRLTALRMPFDHETATGLAHLHVKERPEDPRAVHPAIPPPVATLTLRLLEKVPDRRYRSAQAVAGDLAACLEALGRGHLGADLALSSHEPPSRFRLPAELFGREAETARLREAYEARKSGGRGLVLVNGLPGVGKTALVDTLRRQAALDGAVFTGGKFPRQQSQQPFVAVAAALHGIVHHLLTRPHAELESYREWLRDQLGSRLGLIADLVPEVDLVAGDALARPEPPPGAEQDWLVDACRRFIRPLAKRGAPLVMFIDDVHWMDDASRELLEALLADERLQGFLLVLAFRSREAKESAMLEKLLASGHAADAVRIDLGPLVYADVEAFLEATFVTTSPPIAELAEALMRPSSGNPFYLRRLLGTLHRDGTLFYEPEQAHWAWDAAAVAALDLGEDAVDLVLLALQGYEDTTRTLLHLLACMDGGQSLGTLSEVASLTTEECARQLTDPLRMGILVRTAVAGGDAVYAFAHDRIEQAAYGLLSDEDQPERHLQVALALMRQEPPSPSAVFRIATQLERAGAAALRELGPRAVGLRFVDAAEAALHNAAYDAARAYLQAALAYLPESDWNADYATTLRSKRLHAELLYQAQAFEESRETLNEAIENCADPLQKADLYALLIVQATVKGDHAGAIRDGRAALRELGFELPPSDISREEVEGAIDGLFHRAVVECGRLLEREVCDDAMTIKAMDVLMVLLPPTFFYRPHLNNYVAVMMTELTLDHGVCPASPKGLVNYGTATVERGRYAAGVRFGEIAIELAEKHGYRHALPRVLYTFAGGLNHWTNPLQDTPGYVDQGRRLCTELGERDYEGYLLTLGRCQNEIFLGQPIGPFREQVRDILKLVTEVRNELGKGLAIATDMCLAHLLGETPGPESFDTEDSTEEALLAATRRHDTRLVDCFFFTLKAQNLYLIDRHEAAAECVATALRHANRLAAPMGLAVLPVLDALIAVERALQEEPAVTHGEARRVLDDALSRMAVWSQECPHNFGHLHALLEGAAARLMGHLRDARRHFGRAAAAASRAGFPQFEGIAHRNLARIWQTPDAEDNGFYCRFHLGEARRCFDAWGASRVVAHVALLEERLREEEPDTATAPDVARRDAPRGDGSMTLPDALSLLRRMTEIIAKEGRRQALSRGAAELLAEAGGGSRAMLLVRERDEFLPVCDSGSPPSRDVDAGESYPAALVRWVARRAQRKEVRSGKVAGDSVQDPYLERERPESGLCLPLGSGGATGAVLYVESRNTSMDLSPHRQDLLEALATQAVLAMGNERLRAEREATIEARTRMLSERNAELSDLVASMKKRLETQRLFRRFLSPQIADVLESGGGWEALAMSRREIAIVFCDLRNSTAFASRTQPEPQFELESEYRRCLNRLIAEHGATLDHWAGDGIAAFIGAPVPRASPEQAIQEAVRLAIAIRESVGMLMASWRHLDSSPEGYGIGVAYGVCNVGIVGEPQDPGAGDRQTPSEGWQVVYQARGAYMNLAHRLSDVARSGQILVTQRVKSAIEGEMEVTPVGRVRLKGIDDPGPIFSL